MRGPVSSLETTLHHVQPAMESEALPPSLARRRSFSFPGGGVRAFYQFGVAKAMRHTLGDALKDCDLYGVLCVCGAWKPALTAYDGHCDQESNVNTCVMMHSR